MPGAPEIEIETAPDVYGPGEDTLLCAKHLEQALAERNKTGLAVLDMGCGAGFLGLTAAQSEKVAEVFLCDISKAAVMLAQKNYLFNKSKLSAKCAFLLTDLFSAVPRDRKFDIMIFNTPYLPREHLAPKLRSDETAWDGGENGVEAALRFMSQAREHAQNGSEVLLVSSSFADLGKIKEAAKHDGFEFVDEHKKHIFFEDIVSMRFRAR